MYTRGRVCGYGGGVVGEPLLKGVDYLVNLIGEVKSVFPQSEIRLNTTGNIFGYLGSRETISELKAVGLNSVAVSLNATSKEDYDYLCRPEKKKGASFSNAMDFIGAAIEILGVEGTYVTFVDYQSHQDVPLEMEWPKSNRTQAENFLLPFGVRKENIIFRDYIPIHK